MIKGVKPINNYLNSWLKKNGFKCTAIMGQEFCYDYLNNQICYTMAVDADHDRLFIDVCKRYYPELEQADNFILSFFHELGHFKTYDDFTDSQWEDYEDFITLPADDKANNLDHFYYRYYYHPIEIAATEWGCNYIKKNPAKIKKFWKELQPLLKDFIKVNDIKDE